jgi:CoA:oxalate CoA-transferase
MATLAQPPLVGITVLDFAQYLSGPAAAMRLSDLGARVIKVEPPRGDNCRRLAFRGLRIGGASALFQTVNRGKDSVTADLKDPDDLAAVKELIATADVLIQNSRPGVMERLGLGYDVVAQLNPRIVYASVSGFGPAEDWKDRPGQDLLAQSTVGVPWLNGSTDQPPIAVGTSIADLFAASHLVEGVLACLVRRGVTGRGGRVDVSLLESLLDLVFESFTTYLNTGTAPVRGPRDSAHADIAAPYGIYRTADGHLALSMIPIPHLGELIDLPALARYEGPDDAFTHRSEIVPLIADHLRTRTTDHWLAILRAADAWCAKVLTWPELIAENAFRQGEFIQTIQFDDGTTMRTTRCPIRIDGTVITSDRAAPTTGPRIA